MTDITSTTSTTGSLSESNNNNNNKDTSLSLLEDIDDDEERLVRQVIRENPVEERGVRDEWNQKVGWGRQEDIYKPKQVSSIRGTSISKHNDHTIRHPPTEDRMLGNMGVVCARLFWMIGLAVCCCVKFVCKNRNRQKKQRFA